MVLVHWFLCLLLKVIRLLLQILNRGVPILLYLHEIVLMITHDLETGLVFLLLALDHYLGWETLVLLAEQSAGGQH